MDKKLFNLIKSFFYLFLFVLAVRGISSQAYACDIWPRLQIDNKGTADESWNISMNFVGAQCESKTDTKVEYSYYKYADQSLEKKTLFNIDTGTALPTLKPGDKLRYKACFSTPQTNVRQNPICPPDSDTSYYLGCSLLNTQAGKEMTNLVESINSSGDTSTICREEYFEANFYSNAPLEATVDCSSGRAKVHLFSTYTNNINTSNNSELAELYCPGRIGLGNNLYITDGFIKGAGQKYTSRYCQVMIDDYICAAPLYDDRLTTNDYKIINDSVGKVSVTDLDVLNHRLYHYRFNYRCLYSNDVTVYVNCGDPKTSGGGGGDPEPDPADPENITNPGPCDPTENPNCDYENPEPPSDNDYQRPCKEDYPNGTKCGGGIKIGSLIVSVNNPYQKWSTTEGFNELTTQDWVNGYDNTKTLVENGLPSNPAASYCWNKTDYDYIDWYLPSLYQLSQIRAVLAQLWNSNETDRHLSNYIQKSFGFPDNPPYDYETGSSNWDVMYAWSSNEEGPIGANQGSPVYTCNPVWDAYGCPICTGGTCLEYNMYNFGDDWATAYYFWPRNSAQNQEDTLNIVYKIKIKSVYKTEERLAICVRPASE